MAQKYCKYLANGINFHMSGIAFCNKLWWDLNPYADYGKNALEEFLKNREEVLINLFKGNVPEDCSHCMYLHDADESEISDKINFIEINHWNECNCACFYCSAREATKLKITTKRNQKGVADVLSMLKKLEKLNLLDKDLKLSFVGGEPTLLKDFVNIIKFTIKHKFSVDILTNGILYEKYIPKALLASNNSYMNISLDCGCRETYKRIKGVDEFDNVVKNLARYVKDSKEASKRIMAKYIILEGVNDNKEEIDKWLDLCIKIGITSFFPAIEFCHSVKEPEKNIISDNVAELYQYIKERVRSMGPDYTLPTYDFVEEFIKNRSYNIVK